MRPFPYSPLAVPIATALLAEPVALISVSLATIDATLLARILLQPHPRLLIDCGAQPCRRGLGVCYLLSQLLLLRLQGASVWLCNVDPLLHRCLQGLGLHVVFHRAD